MQSNYCISLKNTISQELAGSRNKVQQAKGRADRSFRSNRRGMVYLFIYCSLCCLHWLYFFVFKLKKYVFRFREFPFEMEEKVLLPLDPGHSDMKAQSASSGLSAPIVFILSLVAKYLLVIEGACLFAWHRQEKISQHLRTHLISSGYFLSR